MPIYAIENLIPVIKSDTYIHPSAEIIGDVIIEEHCYIGPHAVLRGDFGRIHVQHHSNVQDNCVIHSFPNKDVMLHPYSHIGHGAILHGCTIEENVLVGMNAVIMDESIIANDCIVAAMSFVPAKFRCEPGSLIKGTPAKVSRSLSEQEITWKTEGTGQYIKLTQRSIDSLRIVEPLSELQADRPAYGGTDFEYKS
jgi:phenylacetic acid degradation protein